MGFGGSVQGMITSLKNNKRARKSRYDQKPSNSGASSYGGMEYSKKMSATELKRLRESLKTANQKRQRRLWTVFVLVFVPIVVALYLLLF